MKVFILISIGFIFTAIIGSAFIEKMRTVVANDLGYIGEFHQGLGRTIFWSEGMQKNFMAVIDSLPDDDTAITESQEWKRLIKIDTKNHAKIEGIAFLIAIIISLIGMSLLKFGKTDSLKWLGFFLGILFLRYFVTNSIDLINSFKLCNEAKLIKYFGLPVYWTMIGFEILSILAGIWMVSILPIRNKFKVVLAGFVALGVTGFLWLFFAKYLF